MHCVELPNLVSVWLVLDQLPAAYSDAFCTGLFLSVAIFVATLMLRFVAYLIASRIYSD